MNNWVLLHEVKDTGYYIGWGREHKQIHMPEPMQPMSKHSLVQICGANGIYQIHGLTYAHSILDLQEHKTGLKLFDKIMISKTLAEAQTKATELKREIAKKFDDITRSDKTGQLITRFTKAEAYNF